MRVCMCVSVIVCDDADNVIEWIEGQSWKSAKDFLGSLV